MPGVALLHSGHLFGWDAWHLEPTVVGGALIVIGLYVYALTLEPALDWRRVALFAAGALTIFVALASPLDVGADKLLSLHMLQHVLLTTVGPPLVLLGLPREGLRRLVRRPALDRLVTVITLPLIASPLFIVNMWLWHIPPVYDAALTNLGVHIAMHIAFMASGFIFWWPVIDPLPERGRIGEGGKLLYLFVSGFPMGVLALLLIASSSIVYGYYEEQDRLWGVSPLADQQVAGMIMGALGEAASFVAMTLLFFRFLDREEPSETQLTRESIDAA
jgi:putative membrane protein